MAKDKVIGKGLYFSASSLSIFKNCKRCGWMQFKKGIKQPRGIFPSLPGGMDNVLKTYYDKHRSTGNLPPELEGKIKGTLFPDQMILNVWRNWRTGMKYQGEGYVLGGALDDLLIEPSNKTIKADNIKEQIVTILDYKTRGYPPKTHEDSERYYGLQLDIYDLFLKTAGYKTSGKGHLIYYHPDSIDIGGIVNFTCTPVTLDTDPERAIEFANMARDIIEQETPPEPTVGCDYCEYIKANGMLTAGL